MKTFKNFIKESVEDPMLAIRKKVDAKRLVPTRSGAKGGGSTSSAGGGTDGALEEENLEEGNPLARLKGDIEGGRHFVGISAERGNLTPKENSARMSELKGRLKAQGYGYKKAKGVWEGGSENSIIVHAKKAGREGGADLMRDMRKHAEHFDQDAIFHHDGNKGRLVGTNETGYPGKGKSEPVGKVKYNPSDDAPFQTKFKKTASFTTGE